MRDVKLTFMRDVKLTDRPFSWKGKGYKNNFEFLHFQLEMRPFTHIIPHLELFFSHLEIRQSSTKVAPTP